MLTHEYETVVIFRPDLDDAVTKENTAKLEAVITENKGTMLLTDDWGKRKLAYEIDRHLKGHYVLYNFLGDPAAIEEIERRIRINDSIIRFMTVKLEENVDIPARVATAAEERARREEEARVRAEEAAAEAARLAELEASAHAHRSNGSDSSDDDDNNNDEE